MRLRIRRRAKKELLDIDDDATFFAVVRAILELEVNLGHETTTRWRGRRRSTGSGSVETGGYSAPSTPPAMS